MNKGKISLVPLSQSVALCLETENFLNCEWENEWMNGKIVDDTNFTEIGKKNQTKHKGLKNGQRE